MSVDTQTVRRIAHLARVAVADDEVERLLTAVGELVAEWSPGTGADRVVASALIEAVKAACCETTQLSSCHGSSDACMVSTMLPPCARSRLTPADGRLRRWPAAVCFRLGRAAGRGADDGGRGGERSAGEGIRPQVLVVPAAPSRAAACGCRRRPRRCVALFADRSLRSRGPATSRSNAERTGLERTTFASSLFRSHWPAADARAD